MDIFICDSHYGPRCVQPLNLLYVNIIFIVQMWLCIIFGNNVNSSVIDGHLWFVYIIVYIVILLSITDLAGRDVTNHVNVYNYNSYFMYIVVYWIFYICMITVY
jgi:hypothetical protein